MSVPRLPPEVVRLVLDEADGLSLEDILAASHVSRAWRLETRTHRLFARDICLPANIVAGRSGGSLSDGAVQIFLDRLAALPGGRLNLSIYACAFDEDSRGASLNHAKTVLVPALRECLPRLASLTLQCHHTLVPAFLGALSAGPVPQLTTFKFILTDRTGCFVDQRHELPLDIFAGTAPLLRTLQMDGCQFPTSPVPAFAGVRVLIRELDPGSLHRWARDHLHPERFFVNCPALAELSINCHFRHVSSESWGLCPPASVINLRRLTVIGSDEDEETDVIVRAFAHAAMDVVEVPVLSVGSETASLLLAHLDDSATLELDIVDDLACDDLRGRPAMLLRFSVYDAARRRRRTFAYHDFATRSYVDFYFAEYALNSCFSRAAHRFTSISLPGTMNAWLYLSSAFRGAHLVNIQTLTITVSEGLFEDQGIDPDDSEALTLPALTTIKLVAQGARTVEAEVEDLNYLVHDMFPIPEGRSLILELENVSLIGDMNDLTSAFDLTRVPQYLHS